jgi:hypothetical protein
MKNKSDLCSAERNHIHIQKNHNAEGINEPKNNSVRNVILMEIGHNDKALSKPIEAMRQGYLTKSFFG